MEKRKGTQRTIGTDRKERPKIVPSRCACKCANTKSSSKGKRTSHPITDWTCCPPSPSWKNNSQ
ncbi:unnamed protein product [Nesidiocoris tenuis]|uniref:Uncharacterized protein n=1 Tax=Nesidiocoris tenuis TaxID=355587 RepID=A0A6H5GC12_9HEMI|nr:unnamed protein product [Nesidiocoris tenuis]